MLDTDFAARKLQMAAVATTAVSVEKVFVDSGVGERHTLVFLMICHAEVCNMVSGLVNMFKTGN